MKSVKLVAFLICVITILGGVGYWTFAALRPSAFLSRTTMQSSTISPTIPTVTSARNSYISVKADRPSSYYLTLLESNGTEPYVSLAMELRKLPDLSNATAVAKITYLALNATNPEVKEAFQLMIDGGTPDQRDFRYQVPKYNTELQVLYWLACQNEFKRDDTTALAIAMVNGLWVTVGDSEVQKAVSKDSGEFLSYYRETDELLRNKGYWSLEDYPLEAKVALVWTGNLTPLFGPFSLAENFRTKRLPLRGYFWNTVSVDTLRKMRSMMSVYGAMLSGKTMLEKGPATTIHNLEYYFYFMNGKGPSSEHWDYADPWWDDTARKITLDGLVVDNYLIFNIDAMFNEQYLETGKLTGGCTDETAWIDAWAKSVGIATTGLWHWGWDENYNRLRYNHWFNIYYNALIDGWTADDQQLRIGLGTGERYQLTHIFRPPVNQHSYLATRLYCNHFITGDFFHTFYDLTEEDIWNMFRPRVPSSAMKDWLLYTKSTTAITPTTMQEGKWYTLTDESLDVLSENGVVIGDMGEPYIDVASVGYSCADESLYFRFDLNGNIPQSIRSGKVTALWYQVLLDADSNYSTGVIWDDYFTPDYMLEFYVRFDGSSGTTEAYSFVLKYSGNGTDWTDWTEIKSTIRTGSHATLEGGLGSHSLMIRCEYDDVGVSKESQMSFIFRSGILYDGSVYNDPVPDAGPVTVVLPK